MKSRQIGRLLTIVLMLIFVVGCAASPVQEHEGGDMSFPAADALEPQESDNGLFVVSATSNLQPVSINEIHSWTLALSLASGAPVEDATISVDGGMPAHAHGFPTVPEVTEYLGDGKYLLEGVRFNMGGHWQLTLNIEAAEGTDSVSFDMMVK